MAEALARTPWYVIPGSIVALIAIATFIFNMGGFLQKHKTDIVTHAQLRQKMDECQKTQSANNDVISKGVIELVEERKEIWELVRGIDKRTAVMETNVEWITDELKRGRS